jgi:hypothetical protein
MRSFEPKGTIPYQFLSERTSPEHFRQVWPVTGESVPSNSVKVHLASRSPM